MDGAIAGFDWDNGNRAKCSKHGVSADQIESLFLRPVTILPDEAHSLTESRLRAIGRTAAGRHVFRVFTIREAQGRRYIRPLSARLHAWEVS